MYDWKDKVVLITGAANGIGACVVRQALDEGVKHIAILDVDEKAGVAFQEELNLKYGFSKTRFHQCDVTNDEQLFRAFKSLVTEQGNIDVVINNAGIMNDSPNVYKKEIDINVTALVTSTLKALELMRIDQGSKGGTVINIASISGLGQTSFVPVYCSTKAAVIHFSNCIGSVYLCRNSRMSEWNDKVVLITGAANGIGACAVRQALDEGAKHVAILDVDKAGENLQIELNSKYGSSKTKFHYCDVTNDDQVFAAFNSLVEEHGNIDVVINNAGIQDDSPKMYKKEIAINLTAVVTITLKALELMRVDQGGKGGTVINISSITALMQTSFTPIYCGTKAAVLHFSNCIGKSDYFAKTGVRVMTVCFGVTSTALCSPVKLRSHDGESPDLMFKRVVDHMYFQKMESAAAGVIEAYKRGTSASTWLATRDLPPRDITDNVTRAYKIMGEHK